MFRHKQEVDEHVTKLSKLIKSEEEFELRCNAIANAYFKVNEYDKAYTYIVRYLKVRPKAVEANILLATLLEKLNRPQDALQHYKIALSSEPNQPHILLKMCELLANEEIEIEFMDGQKYLEKAKIYYPNDKRIFNLRERLSTMSSDNPEEIKNLYLSELTYNPTNFNVQIRYIKLLIDRLDEPITAFNRVLDIEKKAYPEYYNNLQWYETITEFLVSLRKNSEIDQAHLAILIIVMLDRYITLAIDERNQSLKDPQNIFLQFDQYLRFNLDKLYFHDSDSFLRNFENHYRAQICFHLACLAFKMVKKHYLSYKQCEPFLVTLLLFAYHLKVNPMQDSVEKVLSYDWLELFKRLDLQTAYRKSQSGHILRYLLKEKKALFVNYLIEQYTDSGNQWNDEIFSKIFLTKDFIHLKEKSYFMTHIDINDICSKVPMEVEIHKADRDAQFMNPDSLHHLLWMTMQYDHFEDFELTLFPKMQYSTDNPIGVSLDSFCLLDMLAFLQLCHICTKEELKVRDERFDCLLPACLTSQLGSLKQSQWFSLAYHFFYKKRKLVTGSVERQDLIDAMKVVRCIDSHGLDPILIMQLAKTFNKRAEKLSKMSENSYKPEENLLRVERYWTIVLPMVERLQSNQPSQHIVYPQSRFFLYKSRDMDVKEFQQCIEDGKLFLASRLMKRRDFEKAKELLENLKSPYASFNLAQIYKSMAEETSTNSSLQKALINRAYDYNYLTLRRLGDPSVDPNHPLNAALSIEMEKLDKYAKTPAISNSLNSLNSYNISMALEGLSIDQTYVETPKKSIHHDIGNRIVRTTPYPNLDTVQPSPERLAAEIRNLRYTREEILNKTTVKFKDIADELEIIKTQSANVCKDVISLRSLFKDFIDNSLPELLNKMKSDIISSIETTRVQRYNDFTESFANATNVSANISSLYPNIATPQPLMPPLMPNMFPHMFYKNLMMPEYFANAHLQQQQHPQVPLSSNFQTPTTMFNQMQPSTILFNKSTTVTPITHQPTLSTPTVPSLLSMPHLQPPPVSTPSISSLLSSPNLQPKQTIVTPPSFQPNLTVSTPKATPIVSNVDMDASRFRTTKENAMPANVVITTSDPIPTVTNKVQPLLSVVIPPQHIKKPIGKLTKPPPAPVPAPVPVPAVVPDSDSDSNSDVDSDEDSIDGGEEDLELKLARESCGEEKETLLFSSVAKLYRYVAKEKRWKERGTGLVKLLKDPHSQKVRFLMRRDQIFKVCANHNLSADMDLKPMTDAADKAYIWSAADFAEEKTQWEQFCIKFKEVDVATKFAKIFRSSVDALKKADGMNSSQENVLPSASNTINFGGITFKADPVLKTIKENQPCEIVKEDERKNTIDTPVTTTDNIFKDFKFSFGQNDFSMSKSSTFQFPTSTPLRSGDVFNKTADDSNHDSKDNSDDFEPTAEFKPVIDLPDLVEVKTGEENSEILFESRSKLLRFEKNITPAEWKERGTGVMKILKDEIVRLVMRREKILTLCCNHQLLKNMEFTLKDASGKTVVWFAKDFADGQIKDEYFALKFPNSDVCQKFLQVIKECQSTLDVNSKCLGRSTDRPEPPPDMSLKSFLPSKTNWECKTCYLSNKQESTICIACQTPRETVNSTGKSSSIPATKPVVSNQSLTNTPWSNFKPNQSQTANDSPFKFGSTFFSPPSMSSSQDQKFMFGFGSGSNLFSTSGTKNQNDEKNDCEVISVMEPSREEEQKALSLQLPRTFFNYLRKDPCKGCDGCERDDITEVYGPGPGPGTSQSVIVPPANNDFGTTSGLKFDFSTPKGIVFSSNVSNSPSKQTSLFGANEKQIVFGTNTNSNSSFSFSNFKFGGGGGGNDESLSKPKLSPLAENKILSCDSNLSFANLASSSSFLDKNSGDSFKFENAGKPVFGSSVQQNQSENDDDNDDNNKTTEDDYDPHYEPIIKMPDKIVVTTGEEDEEIVFCERSKLFRYAAGEWKERGVGELKILKHKDQNKWRLLLRRDQVHKIVLNQLITGDINMKPLSSSDKAWTWVANNYIEGSYEQETLAVRFANSTVAKQFLDNLTRCQNQSSD